jgi:hypothetical protein
VNAVGCVSLLATAACFIAWALIRPLGRELEEDEPTREDARFHSDRFSREPAASEVVSAD